MRRYYLRLRSSAGRQAGRQENQMNSYLAAPKLVVLDNAHIPPHTEILEAIQMRTNWLRREPSDIHIVVHLRLPTNTSHTLSPLRVSLAHLKDVGSMAECIGAAAAVGGGNL
ncbi:unnamed protein product [Sphenostylis stenocarpa]|uniref:Uncharacterized protein n=1 Tax=Sphenostylis stenocarpa TaxID=92480 RepID=A0AA86RNL7_9FABA|nr:unnamed protein product [Sphenostylis stenocarpa]